MISMAAFVDEIEKLATHTKQKLRTGSMPIRVHKLVEQDTYDRSTTKTATGEVATGLLKSKMTKPLVTGALTIGAWEALRRANQDRKLGRQMRVQQGAY